MNAFLVSEAYENEEGVKSHLFREGEKNGKAICGRYFVPNQHRLIWPYTEECQDCEDVWDSLMKGTVLL